MGIKTPRRYERTVAHVRKLRREKRKNPRACSSRRCSFVAPRAWTGIHATQVHSLCRKRLININISKTSIRHVPRIVRVFSSLVLRYAFPPSYMNFFLMDAPRVFAQEYRDWWQAYRAWLLIFVESPDAVKRRDLDDTSSLDGN